MSHCCMLVYITLLLFIIFGDALIEARGQTKSSGKKNEPVMLFRAKINAYRNINAPGSPHLVPNPALISAAQAFVDARSEYDPPG
jgi:hypothetical protein